MVKWCFCIQDVHHNPGGEEFCSLFNIKPGLQDSFSFPYAHFMHIAISHSPCIHLVPQDAYVHKHLSLMLWLSPLSPLPANSEISSLLPFGSFWPLIKCFQTSLWVCLFNFFSQQYQKLSRRCYILITVRLIFKRNI